MTTRDLEDLYDAHAGGLYHYFVAFTRREAEARDLLQDLFVKLARVSKPSDLRNEKAWVYRLAHGVAVDAWRRAQVRGKHETQAQATAEEAEDGGTAAVFAKDGVDPDAAVMARQLEEALKALPQEQRSVLQLRLWDQMTFEEVAAAQDIPLNTAASRYRYALEKLRVLLRPLYEELT